MAKGRKVLIFKKIKYDWDTLVFNYCKVDKDEFNDGEVENLDTGEVFNIEELVDIYIEMNQGILDVSNHLSYNKRSKLKQHLNFKINQYREQLLSKKLDDDIITKEELEEYIYLKDNRNIKEELNKTNGIKSDIITKFVKLNQELPLPKEVSLINVGRYYRLLELLIHRNKIFIKPHGNSKAPSKNELMGYLGCSSPTTFKNFMQEMEKHNLARRFKLPNNRNIIFINPLYAHKDLIISNELYNIFKDVLEEKLNKRIFKYLEFIYDDNSKNEGSIVYTNK